jgi:prolyl-tRNA synthetase
MEVVQERLQREFDMDIINTHPAVVYRINLRSGDAACDALCESIYSGLVNNGLKPLYDDTDKRGGEKFAGMDLIGLPWQLTVGPKGAAAGTIEMKYRRTGEKLELPLAAALEKVVANHKAKVA